ncbi:MAG TPA: hypothetical protein VJ921_02515, partial [Vicinamibacteria bacterium]|nr:hypothetical protein [Vicinamibacteria bacterium]
MDDLLGLSFVALAVLFAIWNTASLYQYLAYRRVAKTAELTWPPAKPWFYNLCLGMGFFMVSLTVILVFFLDRPTLTVVAQALMALYYTVLFPLSFQMRRGLYASGLWTESGFVPYARVRALNWIDRPHIVLRVTTEGGLGGAGYARLVVPGELYGEVRRLLAGHIEDRSISVGKSILGLSESES